MVIINIYSLCPENNNSMLSTELTFKERVKLFIAQILVKWGKLTHDDFTQQELQDLVKDVFPYTFNFDIPVGAGKISVLEGNVTLNSKQNRIGIQCLAALNVEVAKSTIYRAHVIFSLSATPRYNKEKATLFLEDLTTDNITLVNDDYALIKDTQFIISKFFPTQVNTLLGKPLRSALSLITAGTSDIAANYLQLYTGGSKQAVLDYHKPQIHNAIISQLTPDDLSHSMRASQWREVLFSRLGKSVRVEENVLRFYLTAPSNTDQN